MVGLSRILSFGRRMVTAVLVVLVGFAVSVRTMYRPRTSGA